MLIIPDPVMSSNETEVQLDAFLVAWGWFAEHSA
jgi:hypothetical protein